MPTLSQAGSPGPSSFALRGAADLASHAVHSPRGPMPSHPIEDDVPSFALDHDVGSPASSVGSVGNKSAGVSVPELDLDKLNSQQNPAPPKIASPAEHTPSVRITGRTVTPRSAPDTGRTPLSSHAVAASSESDSELNTGRTPLSSHAVNASSSSGSGSDYGYL